MTMKQILVFITAWGLSSGVVAQTDVVDTGATTQTDTVTLGDGTVTGGDDAIIGDNGVVTGDDGVATGGDGTVAGGDGDGMTVGDTGPAPDGPFLKLSSGGQKIAKVLYDAQINSADTTHGGGMMGDGTHLSGNMTDAVTGTMNGDMNSIMSLDDIAMAKEHAGWGRVFKDMKAKGLIPEDVKNLGQLVSGKYQPPETGDPVIVTDPDTGAGEGAVVDDGDGTGTIESGDLTASDTEGSTPSAGTAKAKNHVGTYETTATQETTKASLNSAKTTGNAAGRGSPKSELVITTGNGAQVVVGGSGKAKTDAATAKSVGKSSRGKGGKSKPVIDTTTITSGSGAQAATVGAGKVQHGASGVRGGSGGMKTGRGKSFSNNGGGRSATVQSGKSATYGIVSGKGGSRGGGFGRHGNGKGKGPKKIK